MFPLALTVFDRWRTRISTGLLNRWLDAVTFRHPPPRTSAGKEVKLKDEVIQPGESFVLDIEANMERLHSGSSSLIGYRQSQEMQVLLCFPFHCSSYSLR